MERYYQIINIALEAVLNNKFRSILTALGIIFGVAAVIAMMAIGTGAKQEILNQIKLVGVNNIIIIPVEQKDQDSGNDEGEGKAAPDKYSPGLTLEDAESIKSIIPSVERVSPQVIYETFIVKDGKRSSAKLTGVTNDFFEVFNLHIERGQNFTSGQHEGGTPVCIIGPTIESKFFPQEDPIGKYIKCGNVWLKVIGVLENRNVTESTAEDLGISNYNVNIYAPIQTVLLRYKDRSVVNAASLKNGGGGIVFSGGVVTWNNDESKESSNNNQLDKIIVQVKESELLMPTTEILSEMLKRRHAGLKDFEIRVPELLLKQEQKTKDIFNIVLGAIASISLIVGGIGIMNIMLASVLERIREIGVRMATGARRTDIIFQFLAEATLISISGGIIGTLLGIILAQVIMKATGILTIVSLLSIIISFGVSATVGIIFGFMPAKRAASQDPVESLRHD